MLRNVIGVVGSWLLARFRGAKRIPAGAKQRAGPVWWVVANVVDERPYGEGGRETRRGTKHFSPGTKVYCFPPLWGDGYEKVQVVGRHRGSRRYVTMIVASRWLTSWRVQLVYSPAAIAALAGYWDGTAESKELAEKLVEGKAGAMTMNGDRA